MPKTETSAYERRRRSRDTEHPTMGLIARELGLSRYTVSSVLNNQTGERGISEATAQRVRDYLAKRGYVPDRRAVRMKRTDSDVFGLFIVGSLYSHLYDAVNRFFELTADRLERVEVVSCRADEMERGLTELSARRLKRVIWVSGDHALSTEVEARTRILLNRFDRLVLYNYAAALAYPDLSGFSSAVRIVADRQEAYYRLALRLKAMGHRRVALPSEFPGSNETLWSPALARAGMEWVYVRPLAVGDSMVGRPASGPILAVAVLESMRRDGVTAACFGDDTEAGYTMKALVEAGVRIPEDLSVTGMDGMQYTDLFTPPLTTLAMPTEGMVQAALAALAAPEPPESLHLSLELLDRESWGPAGVAPEQCHAGAKVEERD